MSNGDHEIVNDVSDDITVNPMREIVTIQCNDISYIPETVMLAESLDGLLLATVQVYTPAVVTVRVWV